MPVEPKNLNEIPDTGNYIDQPGEYDVLIADAINTAECVTESGTDYFVLKYQDEQGRTIRDSFYDTEKALWRWKQLGEACQLSEAQQANFTPSMVVGKTIHIVVVPQKEKPQYVQVSKLSATGVIVVSPDAKDCPF